VSAPPATKPCPPGHTRRQDLDRPNEVLLVAALLLPLGLWLWLRTVRSTPPSTLDQPSPRATSLLALAVGVASGIYGIGGGSLLGPILVGRGTPAATVAPAALASTFVTSIVGAATYALLSLAATGDVAPDWLLGLSCGAGGLLGGYLGAHLQPHLPETTLRLLLGTLAVSVGALYAVQILR
jgi:uncharacterized protein